MKKITLLTVALVLLGAIFTSFAARASDDSYTVNLMDDPAVLASITSDPNLQPFSVTIENHPSYVTCNGGTCPTSTVSI